MSIVIDNFNHIKVSLLLFTNVMLEECVFSWRLEQSGAGAASTFLPHHPSPSPVIAPGSMSASDVVGPVDKGPYVPAFRGYYPDVPLVLLLKAWP